MRRLLLLGMLVLLLVPASPATASAARYKRCGKVDIGFTDARISARKVACRNARSLVRRWLRKTSRMTCDERNNFCQVVRVRGFRCVRGGDEITVRLRCTRGKQRVRGYWGD